MYLPTFWTISWIVFNSLQSVAIDPQLHIIHFCRFKYEVPRDVIMEQHCRKKYHLIRKTFTRFLGKVVGLCTGEYQLWHDIAEKHPQFPVMISDSRWTTNVLNHKRLFVDFMRNDSVLSAFAPINYGSAAEVQFPVIVKLELEGNNSNGVVIVRDRVQLGETLKGSVPGTYLLQEAIVDMRMFTFYYVAYRGSVLETPAPYCGYMDFPVGLTLVIPNITNSRAKRISCRHVPMAKEVQIAAVRIVALTNFSGLGCFDFKVPNGTQNLRIWEFNPRVCGGLPLPHFKSQILSWWEAYQLDKFNRTVVMKRFYNHSAGGSKKKKHGSKLLLVSGGDNITKKEEGGISI